MTSKVTGKRKQLAVEEVQRRVACPPSISELRHRQLVSATELSRIITDPAEQMILKVAEQQRSLHGDCLAHKGTVSKHFQDQWQLQREMQDRISTVIAQTSTVETTLVQECNKAMQKTLHSMTQEQKEVSAKMQALRAKWLR
ncbi:hypothetical protein WJX74_000660 [Apatococcus lobatus]|uniref:Uncharacterized protein n=1 Tax=Apatococcus lobatus TaxID=904363 RepID=A0AAW1R2M6_9CHLO